MGETFPENIEELCARVRGDSCKSIAWFCSVFWTLNESESELWMYIGRIALNFKNLEKCPRVCTYVIDHDKH